MNTLDAFLTAVRARLSRRRAVQALLWAVIGGAGAVLVVALIYVLRGYAVPRFWYGAGAGLTLLAAAGAALRRAGLKEAAEFADGYFGLKDTVVSRRRFAAEDKSGGYYDLQAAATEAAVRPLAADQVPVPWPRRLVLPAAVLVLACALTALKRTDARILEQEALEMRTEDRMEEIKEELAALVEELEKGSDGDEERALLNPEELKKYVQELQATRDLAEALKQLAKLEGKLDKAAAALEQRRNEELMKKAGEELAKEEDPQARSLAQRLQQEKFREAAKELEKLKPETNPQKKVAEKRREAAKLKAAAKRMAAAARQQKQNRRDQKPRDSREEKGEDGDNPELRDKGSEESPQEDELAEELEKLEMEADQFDKDMEELEEGEKLGQIDLSKLEKSDQDAEKLRLRMDKLGKGLTKMGLKKDGQGKLRTLSRKASQSQNYLQGMAQSPFSGQDGRKPGKGTWEDYRDRKDPLKDNGQTTQLKGQKGNGPSEVKVESADDGTGVSRRGPREIKEGSRKMLESFVQREDVPEEVKQGVKQYFDSLHAAGSAEEAPAKNASGQ